MKSSKLSSSLRTIAASLIIVSCHSQNSVTAEDWPCWRGPRGDGSSTEKHVPVSWNGETGEGIKWKSPLVGYGHSSPIVVGNRVIVTTCLEDTQERCVLSFDSDSGKLIWKSTVIQAPLEIKHMLNSFASGTPASDGKSIYASFLQTDGTEELGKNTSQPKMTTPGRIVVVALDMNGNLLWKNDDAVFSSVHGFCSSPVIYNDLLIVNGDHDGESSILGLDRSTGKIVWRFPRVHQTRSYCTPIVRQVNGEDQLVLSGSKQVVSLNPRTGESNWFVEGPTDQFVASMVYDGSKFYLTAGFPDYFVMAIRPDGKGDVTRSHVAWNKSVAKCYVPSPVLVDKHLFVVDDRGTLNCFNTDSGERLWLGRLGGHYSASLVTAMGLVYCTADDGTVRVVRPGPSLDIVNTNVLGENSFASPAISNGVIYVRGETHLIAIGS